MENGKGSQNGKAEPTESDEAPKGLHMFEYISNSSFPVHICTLTNRRKRKREIRNPH